jgi:hypothetical protein
MMALVLGRVQQQHGCRHDCVVLQHHLIRVEGYPAALLSSLVQWTEQLQPGSCWLPCQAPAVAPQCSA